MASEAEAEILRRHFAHCGSCKSFLANLHESLHEFGSLALLGGAAGDHFTGKVGLVDHLFHWVHSATRSAETGAGKMRLVAYKASGAFSSTDGATAGALAGTSQKVIAICTAGAATTATCLATGVVGPGVGITAPPAKSQEPPPAKVKTVEEPPASAPVPEPVLEPAPEPAPEPEPAPGTSSQDQQSSSEKPSNSPPSESTPAPAPVEQSHSEFGIEGGSSPAPAPAPAPSTSPAPTTGSSLSGSGSGGGGGSGGGSSSSGSSSGGGSSGGGSIGFNG